MAEVVQFQVLPVERFATGTVRSIKKPEEIAYFSFDENHVYRQDDSALRYYYPPPIGANLSEGFDHFRQFDDCKDEHIDGLLASIMGLEKRTGQRVKTDLITWRGMMTKIMSAPYDRFNSFQMRATLFQDTIFIEEDHSAKVAERREQKKRQGRGYGPSQELMSYWGYKFETLSLIPDIWDATSRDYIEGREKEVVSNYAQYCSVVQTGIGHTKMVIGGEVDAVWDQKPDSCQKPDDPIQPINWVELKTSQEIESDTDMVKFERKLYKFWIQSYLLGVPKIIVGFRSRDGILKSVQEFKTMNIPGEVKRNSSRNMNGTPTWNGNMCISWTAQFLEFLKNAINSDGVWKIRRRERSAVIEVFQEEIQGTGGILSKDFLEWRKDIYAREVANTSG